MLKSILSMITVRGITLVFPLFLIPLQLKLLGISQYGEYNLLFAISAIGSIFINYGFDYSTSRDIVRSEGVLFKISYICSSAFYCKLLNFLLVTSVMFIIYLSKEGLEKFFVISVFLFSQVLIPIYAFQGMKKMEYLIYNTIFLNISFLLIILYFLYCNYEITSSNLFLIYSIINLIAALQMLCYLNRKYSIKLTAVSIADIVQQYKNGSWIFLSRVMSSGLSQWTIVILSTIFNPTLLGIYTLSDKLVRAGNSFFYAVQQATYPYFCSQKSNENLTKIMVVLVVLAVLALAMFCGLKDFIIYFFPALSDYYASVIIMFSSLIPMCISGMIGVNYLLATDQNKIFAFILGVAAIFNIVILYLYVTTDSMEKAALVMLTTESLVAIMMYVAMWLKERKNGY
ncbi:oligosaccharide flippase family protein [Escherichia coli]|nr:oligosaccharide flippase family protein [Escherichia coli]MCV5273645.1 oligosaccharide flippase family protein [Escherichia coli]